MTSKKSLLKAGMKWHRRQESNPHFRFWRPMRYHYTTPVRPVIVAIGLSGRNSVTTPSAATGGL